MLGGLGGGGVGGKESCFVGAWGGIGGVEGCFLTRRRGDAEEDAENAFLGLASVPTERRAEKSTTESAEAAEIIGLRREAEALFWKEEGRQWRISTGHNARPWRASPASLAARGFLGTPV